MLEGLSRCLEERWQIFLDLGLVRVCQLLRVPFFVIVNKDNHHFLEPKLNKKLTGSFKLLEADLAMTSFYRLFRGLVF